MINAKTLPNLLETVKGYAKVKGSSLRKISKKIGKAPNYLSQTIKKDAPVSLLLELSELLKVNLVEHYTILLSPALQTTHRERILYNELDQLKKELRRVEQERDKYWEVISKK